MPQFLGRFDRVSESASGAGFWKGLLTAMIELGALLGALNQGWVADKISRKYSIGLAVVIFTIGSILQTAAVDYAMLVVARLIGGVGIGMLSMVVSTSPEFLSSILFLIYARPPNRALLTLGFIQVSRFLVFFPSSGGDSRKTP